jgi:predicted enzyme related to lactoylglutathione lyase
MPVRTSYKPGTPSWTDLMTPSRDRSQKFYGSIFGWKFENQKDDDGNVVYVMCMQNGKSVAGMGEMSAEMAQGMPPVWSTYISTSDLDATTKKVEAAGGSVMVPPTQVFESGRMAVYSDPTGAAVSAWEPAQHIGAELVNEPCSMAWNELDTRDVDAAKTFYSAVFGWKGETADGPIPYTEWQLGDATVGGMMPMPAEVPAQVPSYWLSYFAVADCDDTVARASKAGGTVMVPPMDIPAGRFSVLNDPEGAMFAVIALTNGM